MNSFLFAALSVCLIGQCALAQYQQSNGGHYMQQRKLAPTPQTYGSQNAGYGAAMEPSGYGAEQQQQQQQHYEQPSSNSYSSRAPSAASVSQYDERAPAASYGKPAAAPVAAYGRQQQQAGYSAAPAASYQAKPARYEEPYHPPTPFAWGYDINDGYGGAQFHKENGDEYGKRTGSYGYTDAYGIYRQVDYVADEHGFRATIKTNEPGTANESPADVELHAYEPPSNYYAGNTYNNNNNNKESYGKQGYGGAAAAASPTSSYSAPAQSHSAPAYGSASYSAPRGQSYSSAPRSTGYKQQQQQQQQAAYAPMMAQRGYEQYSSSSLVPVYQKAAPKAVVAPKRY